MNPSAGRFSAAAMSAFVARLGLLMGEFGYSASDIDSSMSAVRAVLATRDRGSLRLLGEFLQISGIGQRWNQVLNIKRAPFLAALIAPHVVGTALDLLCGNGAVARAIEDLTGR